MIDNIILAKLIVKAQNGDESSFNELYYATNNYVYNIIYDIVKNKELAEELVQETFLKLLQAKLKNEDNGLSYLLTIAKNLALNTYNQRKRLVYIDFDKEENLYRDDLIKDNYNYLDILFDNLSEYQSDLIKMHIYEGLTHKEIAKKLNKPIGTIMWQYNEALKKLRKNNKS